MLKQGKEIIPLDSKSEILVADLLIIVLQLPMRKASPQIVFINTSPPDERVELLKPMTEIENTDDDCEEIYTSGL